VNGILGTLLVMCCAIAIACGGAQAQMSVAPAAPPVATPAAVEDARGQDPRAEIEALDRQITDELARANVARPMTATCTGAACAEAMSQPFTTPRVADPQCHPASTDRCSDACTLSTSICNTQQKICALANQLAGDDWAANKCESAKTSCQAAHDRCCSCVP
jgi:hypothetical protein